MFIKINNKLLTLYYWHYDWQLTLMTCDDIYKTRFNRQVTVTFFESVLPRVYKISGCCLVFPINVSIL